MDKHHIGFATARPSATGPTRDVIAPSAPTDLARQAGEALGLLERYRHVDPVAAVCGLDTVSGGGVAQRERQGT